MKRLVLAAALTAAAFVPAGALAQDTSSGVLTVTATVASSISLTFESDPSGIALGGSGTNAATMAFGSVSAFGTIATAGVTRSVGATDFTVSSPFGVKVVTANSTSASYNLAASLGSADATNTWKVGATTLSTAPATVATSQGYGSAVAHTLAITIPKAAAAGAISRTVNFTATAN
jgi:hypothetical protein